MSTSLPIEISEPVESIPIIKIRDFDFAYGDKQALFGINMDINEKEVTAAPVVAVNRVYCAVLTV